eukprot:730470-Hanusia_phi.AAC.1
MASTAREVRTDSSSKTTCSHALPSYSSLEATATGCPGSRPSPPAALPIRFDHIFPLAGHAGFICRPAANSE